MGILSVGVLASGRGSNLQSIIDASEKGQLGARVAVVISDNEGAFALERAKRHKIPNYYVNPKAFANRAEYERKIVDCLKESGVDLVCLAGYMRLVGPVLLESFKNRVINIHPALLPAFPGLHAQEQAFDYGVRYSGCTVHFVDEGMDTGPIILQAAVSVIENDTAASLADRILEQEHIIYPQAIKLIAQDRVYIKGRKVVIKPN